MKDALLNALIYESPNNLPDDIKDNLMSRVSQVNRDLEKAKTVGSGRALSNFNRSQSKGNDISNKDAYTDIIDLINTANGSKATDFNSILDNIFEKNKKYFSILKDYEIMPILIPQITRILSFLVNECISPDIHSSNTFTITCTSKDNESINKEIESIRIEQKLDQLLKNIYTNRFKLGREYYAINNYKDTFEAFKKTLDSKMLNESAGVANMSDIDYLNYQFESLKVTESKTLNESSSGEDDLTLESLNITIERTDILAKVKELKYECMCESYKDNSTKAILNEAITGVDSKKGMNIIEYLSTKDLDKCSITRLDPARVFKLSPSGKTVGYFYVTDNNPNTNVNRDVEMGGMLRDRLLKSKQVGSDGRKGNDNANAEKIIVNRLAEKIINTFDPNIGISNIEDIDLLHDYMLHNNIINGNKKIIFYYADDIVDFSREDESLLINAVFFTKLYATLMLNNISTKILRGRGRQIHTVNVGVSPAMSPYIQAAIATLTMPNNNLGNITGSFKTLFNPLNSSSDIVLPRDEGTDPFITTDIVEGQNVDMDMDILRFILNSIIMSFGLDSAVIDTTNGNIDFAKTLSMLSLQIANSTKAEQSETLPPWKELVLSVFRICGSDSLRAAIDNGEININFFSPKTLLMNMTMDELNNVKQVAETFADVYPELQMDDEDANLKRLEFIYSFIRSETNVDWAKYDALFNNLDITKYKLKRDIANAVKAAQDNSSEEEPGALSDEELADDDLGEF